jgi:anti-sigma B factor antagonist
MTALWQSSAWVEVSQGPETLVLRLCGELDMSSCRTIEPALLAAIASADTVELDLRGVEFCDSSGIAMFLGAREHAEAEGADLFLTNLPTCVARVFRISGVDRVLQVVDG